MSNVTGVPTWSKTKARYSLPWNRHLFVLCPLLSSSPRDPVWCQLFWLWSWRKGTGRPLVIWAVRPGLLQ